MSYSERAYFENDHCQHCAAREDYLRIARARRMAANHWARSAHQRP